MQPVFAEIFGPDILIVLAIVLLLFGSTKLPQLARSLGQAKKELQEGMRSGAERASEVTTCPACGREGAAGHRFCASCGAPLASKTS